MTRRRLPTLEETRAILASKRTRPAHRPPPPAGRALNAFIRQLDAKYGQGSGALTARWKEIVGPEIARRTEPVKLTRGRNGGPSTLEVRVSGPAAAIIQHQAHEVLARVNAFLGPDAVQKLRIVQGPLQRAEPPAPLRRRSVPLDAAAEARLAEGLAEAPDGKIKDALMALGRGVLKRQGQG